MAREISSIKPEIRKIGNKKFIAGRTTVKEPEEIKFYYSSEEYDTFEKRDSILLQTMKDLTG